MIRFFRNCTALLLVVAAILWLGGAAYRQTTVYQNLELSEETYKYKMIPKQVSFAVLGSSHGRAAYQAEDYGEDFFNFSLSSQTPQYDLMQLRQFQNRIPAGATVILTVSYFSPFWSDSQEAFENKQGRYYRILSPQNIVNCDIGYWVLGRLSPLLITDFQDVLSAFLNPPELVQDENVRSVLSPDDLDTEQARIRKNHLSLIEPAMPEGNPVMLEAYRAIFDLCREKEWKAVLVTPPYLAVYSDCFPAEVLARFRELTLQLSSDAGVPWLDYSQDARFTQDFSLFKDIDHLNPEGAAKFSQIIQEQLLR